MKTKNADWLIVFKSRISFYLEELNGNTNLICSLFGELTTAIFLSKNRSMYSHFFRFITFLFRLSKREIILKNIINYCRQVK